MKSKFITVLTLTTQSVIAAPIAYTNANIVTVDDKFSIGSSMIVSDGLITAIGNSDILDGYTGKTIDMKGHTILPSFIDPHYHVSGTAKVKIFTDLSNGNIKDIKKIASQSDKEWILIMNIGDDNLTAEVLDSITDKPTFVWHKGGHAASANSAGMKKLDLNGDGIIKGADLLVPALMSIPEFRDWTAAEGVYDQKDYWLSHGLSMLGDAGIGNTGEGYQAHLDMLELYKRDFPIRIRAYISANTELSWRENNMQVGGDDRYKVIGFKFHTDGSNQAKTALQRKPYEGEPDNKGIAYSDRKQIEARLRHWGKKGFQFAIHANGDAGIDAVIDSVRTVKSQGVQLDNVRIEHCSIVNDDQIESMKELGISCSFLIGHVKYFSKDLESALGERINKLDRAKSFSAQGIPYSFHSDAPVLHTPPLEMIEIAVTRQDIHGQTIGAKEAISVEDAIKAVTIVPAYQMLSDDKVGSLEVGKYADFVVLNQNPLYIDVDDISEIQVLETWINGNKEYARSTKK
ncbi:amidohydrolase [Vibrio comitans]